ncbi:hypothetical protein [Desulfolucanica intricata]|uniref:hypothetical protein n=1 Tax=Desulfolucanica intricata TaxID=1285191 RepID=UPI00082F49E7|nr:hypothetical protein [Desulfolucanica intricata]
MRRHRNMDLERAVRVLGGSIMALFAKNIGIRALGTALATTELLGRDIRKSRRKLKKKYYH